MVENHRRSRTREEKLGVDPTGLGSPLSAAVASKLLLLGGSAALVAFGIGHLVGASVP